VWQLVKEMHPAKVLLQVETNSLRQGVSRFNTIT
jgi:hypothetical protein